MKKGIILLLLLFGMSLSGTVFAASSFTTYTPSGEILREVLTPEIVEGNPSLFALDLGSDGVDELLVGNGPGAMPRVSILRADGSELSSFLAYEESMTSGVHVIGCDLDGDQTPEIITGPGRGYKPLVKIFDNYGHTKTHTLAYAEQFIGGVHLACGNLDEEPGDELVTLPSVGGGPHVRIWKWENGSLVLWREWFAYDSTDRDGMIGVVVDHKLILANEHKKDVRIRTFEPVKNLEHDREEVISLTQPGVTSLFVANNTLYFSTAYQHRIYEVATKNIITLAPTEAGVFATPFRSSAHDGDEVITTSRNSFEPLAAKSIKIDLSEQRLTAYEFGREKMSFLISSGRAPFITPLGNHTLLAKKPHVLYQWNYGPGNPNNYDLGVVPYNLLFYPHIYIHYAYWHNNFGTPQSHGCVNVSLENMKALYEWSEEGIPVHVVE